MQLGRNPGFSTRPQGEVMVTLIEALAAERAKRRQDEADTATRQQIGRAVLEALAERLNAEPLPGWLFILDGQEDPRLSHSCRQS